MTRARRSYGLTFVFAGVMHFLVPRRYEAIMPPYVPAHREMVMISGAAEVLGGLAVLVPRLSRPARWWNLVLLAAIFPANVHMAVNPDEIEGLPDIPRWLLWVRLPFQAVFMAWAVRATRND